MHDEDIIREIEGPEAVLTESYRALALALADLMEHMGELEALLRGHAHPVAVMGGNVVIQTGKPQLAALDDGGRL